MLRKNSQHLLRRFRVYRTLGCVACVIILLLFAGFLAPLIFDSAYAQETGDELQVVNFEGISHAPSEAEAIRDISAKAMSDTAREQVLEIIGERKYAKSKNLIERKIIAEAVKFIPIVNNKGIERTQDGGFKMGVEMKVSTGSLRKMILAAGLLAETDGPTSLLPMIEFADQSRNQNLVETWWTGANKKVAGQLSDMLHHDLAAEMGKQGFFVLKPSSALALMIPESYRLQSPPPEDFKFYSEIFKVAMLARGEVILRSTKEHSDESELALKIGVFQASNLREIAEVARTVSLGKNASESAIRAKAQTVFPEITKDLATQVMDTWQKGTLGTSTLKLSVRGKLNPKQLNEFKTQITKAVREIKGMKERMFEPGRTVFELDYAGATGQIPDRFKSVQLPGFDFRVSEATPQGISADIQPKKGS